MILGNYRTCFGLFCRPLILKIHNYPQKSFSSLTLFNRQVLVSNSEYRLSRFLQGGLKNLFKI